MVPNIKIQDATLWLLLFVSLLALGIGLRVETRNQKRFEAQLSQSQKVAQAAARPILAVGREGYEDVKSITIDNHGPGTAIIQEIKFIRGKREAMDISELLTVNKGDKIVWNESTAYATPSYLAGKSSEDVFRITAERLDECKMAPERIETVMSDIEKQLDEIDVFIKYEDVFGTRFKLSEKS